MMKKTALVLLATLALAAGSNGQMQELVGYDVAGFGTAANGPTPTVTNTTAGGTASTDVTATALARNTVTFISTANAFNSNNWNATATLSTAANYISFDITAATPVTFSSLQFAINGSNTAPNMGQWAYTLDGGNTFTLATTADGGAFTNQNAARTALSTWTFDTPFTLATNATVEFRFFEYGATAINGGVSAVTGTTRIQNITGNDLVVNFSTATATPEPSTWAMMAGGAGLLGVMFYRRSRMA